MLIPGWRHTYSGKVRDLYEPADTQGGPQDVVLVVASDRISAYDHVLTPEISGKGEVLTSMSRWWFDRLGGIVPNHLLGDDEAAALPAVPKTIAGRAMLCRRLDMFPVECVVRGYLTGSGLAEYRETGSVAGIELPGGLVEGSRLPDPIFTPARKAAVGEHDENVTFEQVAAAIGADDATALRDLSLAIYAQAETAARERGLILADTKFEFGRNPATGAITLGDEVLTPDSSRYWAKDSWLPGRPQASLDKQPVRDWLLGGECGWSPSSSQKPPPLPTHVVEATAARYRDVATRFCSTSSPSPNRL
jgi:phosphoribosylaminoimidazole-succinocarboxamide synthase